MENEDFGEVNTSLLGLLLGLWETLGNWYTWEG